MIQDCGKGAGEKLKANSIPILFIRIYHIVYTNNDSDKI